MLTQCAPICCALDLLCVVSTLVDIVGLKYLGNSPIGTECGAATLITHENRPSHIMIPSSHTSSSGLSSYLSPSSLPSTPITPYFDPLQHNTTCSNGAVCVDRDSGNLFLDSSEQLAEESLLFPGNAVANQTNPSKCTENSDFAQSTLIDRVINDNSNNIDLESEARKVISQISQNHEVNSANDSYELFSDTISETFMEVLCRSPIGYSKNENILLQQKLMQKVSLSYDANGKSITEEKNENVSVEGNSISRLSCPSAQCTSDIEDPFVAPLDFTESDILRLRLGSIIVDTRASLASGIQISRIETHPTGEVRSAPPQCSFSFIYMLHPKETKLMSIACVFPYNCCFFSLHSFLVILIRLRVDSLSFPAHVLIQVIVSLRRY